MSDFKGRRFPTDVMLVCGRWYCKCGISYRDLAEMMSERGFQSIIRRFYTRFSTSVRRRCSAIFSQRAEAKA